MRLAGPAETATTPLVPVLLPPSVTRTRIGSAKVYVSGTVTRPADNVAWPAESVDTAGPGPTSSMAARFTVPLAPTTTLS